VISPRVQPPAVVDSGTTTWKSDWGSKGRQETEIETPVSINDILQAPIEAASATPGDTSTIGILEARAEEVEAEAEEDSTEKVEDASVSNVLDFDNLPNFSKGKAACLSWVEHVDGYVESYNWSTAELHDVVYLMLQGDAATWYRDLMFDEPHLAKAAWPEFRKAIVDRFTIERVVLPPPPPIQALMDLDVVPPPPPALADTVSEEAQTKEAQQNEDVDATTLHAAEIADVTEAMLRAKEEKVKAETIDLTLTLTLILTQGQGRDHRPHSGGSRGDG